MLLLSRRVGRIRGIRGSASCVSSLVIVTRDCPISSLAQIGVSLNTRVIRRGRTITVRRRRCSWVVAVFLWRTAIATVCRSASSAPLRRALGVCCISSDLLVGWISACGNSGGLWGGGVWIWRCACAITSPIPIPVGGVTSGGCRSNLALDSVESALDLFSTSRYDGLSIAISVATEVPSFECMSANDLPRS